MKFEVVLKGTAAAALALALAACGGGGGASTPSLAVGGTAATGAALAGATVAVKCVAGSGTATTNGSGGYTVTVEDGALPCIVRVTGTTAGGTPVILHSIVASGTTGAGNTTTATANVTPITEMIVAQLMAAMPTEAFDNFDAARVSSDTVAAALTAIVNALKTAGVDLAGIDPLKAELVPASGSTAGNAYDQVLDTLGQTVPPEALPQVVNQIANAASSGSSEGLQDAMAAVEGGTLPGCPAAVSGRYRSLEYFGRVQVRNLDFKNMKFGTEGQAEVYDIAQDASDACKFKVSVTVSGVTTEFAAAIGAAGVGNFKAVRSSNPPGVTGYLFPVQSHAASAYGGDWAFVQSGFVPNEGLVHRPGKLGVASDGKVSVCDYDDSGTCTPDTGANLTATARSDGGVDLNEATQSGVANLWGYRSPSGSFTVFGTTNAAGASGATIEETHIVATRATKLPLPAVGDVHTAWTAVLRQTGDRTTRTVQAPTLDTNTVTSVNVAESWYTRKLDGQDETIYVNKPVDGFRKRLNVSGTWFYQLPLPGTGVTVGFNAVRGPSLESPYLHSISVNKQ